MKFNIADYPGQYVMHCTLDEAPLFQAYLHSLGRRWATGKSYGILPTQFQHLSAYDLDDITKNGIGYNFNNDKWCNIDWYKDEGFTILNFSEFDWDGYTDNSIDDIHTDELISMLDF